MSDDCLNCGKDIGIDIEFGGRVIAWGIDGDGFVCDRKCYDEYRKKINHEMSMIGKMTDSEFERYMLG